MTRQFENKKLPEKLYKYRDWTNKFHRRLISHQELYFAKPSSFNDPFDGNIPVRWDLLTYEDCFKKNLELVEIFHGDKSDSVQKQIAKSITDSKKSWHPDKIKKETPETLAKWDNIIGLVSLSESNDDILMWSHYSNFHTGFVVGFYADSLNQDYNFDYLDCISYMDEYPIISGNDDTTERFKKKFFSKSLMWEYEKEWRITKNHIKQRIVKLPKKSFAEIIRKEFGEDFRIFQARKSDQRFGLELIEG